MRRVSVKAHYPAAGRHPFGQQVKNPARAAPQVDRTVTRPQTSPAQQCRTVGRQFISLPLEPGALTLAAAQRINGVSMSILAFP